jgi:hypothetical protein
MLFRRHVEDGAAALVDEFVEVGFGLELETESEIADLHAQ